MDEIKKVKNGERRHGEINYIKIIADLGSSATHEDKALFREIESRYHLRRIKNSMQFFWELAMLVLGFIIVDIVLSLLFFYINTTAIIIGIVVLLGFVLMLVYLYFKYDGIRTQVEKDEEIEVNSLVKDILGK